MIIFQVVEDHEHDKKAKDHVEAQPYVLGIKQGQESHYDKAEKTKIQPGQAWFSFRQQSSGDPEAVKKEYGKVIEGKVKTAGSAVVVVHNSSKMFFGHYRQA